jgi:hypothetical protein
MSNKCPYFGFECPKRPFPKECQTFDVEVSRHKIAEEARQVGLTAMSRRITLCTGVLDSVDLPETVDEADRLLREGARGEEIDLIERAFDAEARRAERSADVLRRWPPEQQAQALASTAPFQLDQRRMYDNPEIDPDWDTSGPSFEGLGS